MSSHDSSSCPSSSSSDAPADFPSSLIVALSAIAGSALLAFCLNRRRASTQAPLPPRKSPPSTPSAISALARHYLSQDPDPNTRHQLESQLHSIHSDTALRERLSVALDPVNRIRFGTAGVRAEVGLGYNRLNVLNVIAVAQAVYRVLEQEGKAGNNKGCVVVGYDARPDSERFAVVIADVFRRKGVRVWLFSRFTPTPFVAFAIREYDADAGLCVTASHNPPKDNGIKVFWGDGIQIRGDVAAKIENRVRECGRPWESYVTVRASLGADVMDPVERVEMGYYNAIVRATSRRSMEENKRTRAVVYTACHGVGRQYVDRMFEAFGLPHVLPCVEQCEPDGLFPTLPFPNPEEKGALDLAIQTAKKASVRLILANDPDADRLGAAEIANDGNVKVFTGNEIAVLLADYLSGEREGEDMSKYAVVASAVSSKITASMARKRGFMFREALTGFKWLNKVALDLEKEGKIVLLTYEEALGFNITRNVVRDKDGVSAAAVFAEMAGQIYDSGGTLSERLDELLDECGVHLSMNGYLRTSSTSKSAEQVFADARELGFPTTLGGAVVKSIRDLTLGTDLAEADGKACLPSDPRSQFLTFRCDRPNSEGNDHPLIIHLRGSGTEPKIKYYSELRCTQEEANSGAGQAFLQAAVVSAIEKVLRPDENGLSW